MYWVNSLHIYQPPTQSEEIVRKVTFECYRPLMRILKEHKTARVTLNINACLTEQLIRYGFSDVIDGIGQLAQEGRVELTGSAKYHPILPLIPKDEMKRQIELNQESNERYFKGVYRPKGFFLPEMCYSRETAEIVKTMGFEWMLADEIAYDGKLGHCRNNNLYTIESLAPMKIFFKERRISTAIAFGRCQNKQNFVELNKNILSENVFLLTGTDGEVYGHHHLGQGRLLEEIFDDGQIPTCTISRLSELFLQNELVEPLVSSWSSWEDEIEQGIPFPQWNDPKNKIHQCQWELMALSIDAVKKMCISDGKTLQWQKARHTLDEGLHSCQWWWASCRPWWGPDMVSRGVALLTQTVLDLRILGLEESYIEKAVRLKEGINQLLREWETSGYARDRQKKYLQSHKEISSLLRFG